MKVHFFILCLTLLSLGCATSQSSPEPRLQSLLTPLPTADAFHRVPASSDSLASAHLDGCYQMLLPGSMYPAFCLSGTMEEGIGGAGVRLVIYGANTNIITGCAVSSKTGFTKEGEFFFEAEGARQLTLRNVEVKNEKPVSGDVQIGKTNLKFVFIEDRYTNPLKQAYAKHQECQNVGVGQLKSFKSSQSSNSLMTPVRRPASETRVLRDFYGDNVVYFCSADTAVVSMDPNQCSKALAQGASGCTELATYTSPVLKVEKRGGNLELLDKDNRKVHLLKANSEGYLLPDRQGSGAHNFIQLKVAKATDNDQATMKYICQ